MGNAPLDPPGARHHSRFLSDNNMSSQRHLLESDMANAKAAAAAAEGENEDDVGDDDDDDERHSNSSYGEGGVGGDVDDSATEMASSNRQGENSSNGSNGTRADPSLMQDALQNKTHRRSLTLPGYVRRRSSLLVEAKNKISTRLMGAKKPDASSIPSSSTTSVKSDSPPNSPKARVISGKPNLTIATTTTATTTTESTEKPPALSPSRSGLPPLSFRRGSLGSSKSEEKPQQPKAIEIPPIPLFTGSINTDMEHSSIISGIDSQRMTQKSSSCSEEATQLCSHLILSGDLVAKNKEQLLQLGVTHVLNVARSVCDNYFDAEKRFEYISFFLEDSPDEAISNFFLVAVAEIERVRKNNGIMLIHCQQGISRSCTIAIAYLMWLEGLGCDEAFRVVRQKRSVCCPNVGFMLQLKAWEKRLRTPPTKPSLQLITPHSKKEKYLIAKWVFSMSTSGPPPSTSSRRLSVSFLEDKDSSSAAGSAGSPMNALKQRARSITAKPIVFPPELLNNKEAYLLHVPSAKTIFIWIGKECPQPEAYDVASTLLATWMIELEPAFKKDKIVKVCSTKEEYPTLLKAEEQVEEAIFWKTLLEGVEFGYG